MKMKSMLVAALFLLGATLCFSADVNMGTWKLNDAKSKLNPAMTKNHTVTYEAAGDSVKVSVDGVSPDGKDIHSEWTGKFDGKDYPLTGDPTSDTRAYKRINRHTLNLTGKKDGKVITTAHIVVSANGKTRTVTSHAWDAKGKKITTVGMYDKQ